MPAHPNRKDTWVLPLSGHLTFDALEARFQEFESAQREFEERGEPRTWARLLVNATEMTGYDPDARALFVRWHGDHRDQITHVAIVTENTLWRVVIGGMALASRQNMQAFTTDEAALEWLGEHENGA